MAMTQKPWLELYKAALLEVRHEALPARITDAEAAIGQRQLELRGNLSAECLQEQINLDDALRGLRVLAEMEGLERREQDWPPPRPAALADRKRRAAR
jgi:hypothetical protein